MISKIASALARVLAPIKPIQRSDQSIKLSKSPDGGEGGHGPLGYSALDKQESEPEKSDLKDAPEEEDRDNNPSEEKITLGGLPLQSGLTQVILELNQQRTGHLAGAAVHSYETGAKEQKKNCRLPKGSMLDKKAG